MPEKSGIFTGRQLEETYFLEKERELINRLKARAAQEASRKALSEVVGVSDEGILQTLEEMGFDREVVVVLHLFPLVVVAWADGEISEAEKAQILEAARARDVHEGTAADEKLAGWLSSRPDEVTTRRALRVIRDIMEFRGPEHQQDYSRGIIQLCSAVAEASGGLLGFGRRASARERDAIRRIAAELEAGHKKAATRLLSRS